MIENIFENIIEITLSVSIVIALLLILSKVLDKNYTAKWRYWIWLVLAIRLILPFNMTISDPPINLFVPEMSKTVTTINNVQNIQTKPEIDIVMGHVNENFVLPEVEASRSETLTTNNVDIIKILIILWITGIVIFLMYQLIIYFLYRRSIKPWCMVVKEQGILSIYENICKEIKVIKRIPIMTCKPIKSPMVIGFWNPTLLLPDMVFSTQHLEMILRHELIHVKRRDILYKTLILLARAVHWFNPLVHLMAMEANKDVELSCDAAVVENQNVDYRKDYSEAILSVIHKGSTSKAVFSTYFGGGKKMLKKRFANLFDFHGKRKGIISMIMIVLILGIIGLCINYTQNTRSNTEDNIIYKNETLGFSLEFPRDWKDKYIIEESNNNITIFSKKVYENYDGAGLLFTIERMTGELITKEDMQQAPVSQQIVLQGNGYTYFTRMPSDVQYPPNDEELSNDYKAMSKQISKITQSISILGDKKPKATNEGFKVAGSSFFTVEIPNNWELKVLKEFPLCWNIYAGDNNVGGIELIPYKSEETDKITPNDNMIREYLFNDEAFRKMRITLDSGYTDKETMAKIKNSFKFVDGTYNVVDLQTNAEQYITRGGKKIFGTIEGFNMENEKPVAVRINVMKFLTDDIDNKYPSGYDIENLNRIETYSLDFGVRIVPLAAPNYNTYETYEMPLLNENFIKNYKNYKDFYYDFIIANDGQLKIILGHYVP